MFPFKSRFINVVSMLFGIVLPVFSGCGVSSSVELTTVNFKISLSENLTSQEEDMAFTPPPLVNSIRVNVSGDGMSSTTTRLFVRESDFIATTDPIVVSLLIPIGANRTFTAMAFVSSDGTGPPIFQGSTTGVTLTSANENNVAAILLTPSSWEFPHSWRTRMNLSNNAGGSFLPSGALSGNTTIVAWGDTTSGNNDIFMTRSTDGGQTFSMPVNISHNAGSSVLPSVVVSGTTAIIAWQDNTQGTFPTPENNDIFIARSTDGGQTFSIPVNITHNAESASSPSLALFGNTAIVAWVDRTPDNKDIFIARSTDGGQTFSAPDNISHNAGSSSSPSIALEGKTAIVAWEDNSLGNFDIFVARSTDHGQTFSVPINISDNTGHSFSPSLALSGKTAFIAWQDDSRGDFGIFMTQSKDRGKTFSDPINFESNTGYASSPSVGLSGSVPIVAWVGHTQGNTDIFSTQSTDGGKTFSVPINISDHAGYSFSPSVVLSEKTAIIVWEDNTLGNFDIFLTRSEQGNSSSFSSYFASAS